MEWTSQLQWPQSLEDPIGLRARKPRIAGLTMVIDKGLGLNAFEDLLETAGDHIDTIKLGFGTAALYTPKILLHKIKMARALGIDMMPGGTFLEVACAQRQARNFIKMVSEMGFNSIEVSDGTIDLSRSERNELIQLGLQHGLKVNTEYGKKAWGSQVESNALIETIQVDLAFGASLVTVEGRESGAGVGIYDANGDCRDEEIQKVLCQLDDPAKIMWETPQKAQQVYFIKMMGPNVNLGNIAPGDIIALEALRRGLRSDTFTLA